MSQHSSAQRSNAEQSSAAPASAQFQPRPFAPVVEAPIQGNPEDLQAKEETKQGKKGLVHDLTRGIATPPGTEGNGNGLFAASPVQRQSEVINASNAEYLSRMFHYSRLQAKLTVGAVGDKYEQEADAVAARVVEQINSPPVQREGEEEELQMKLQRKPILPILQKVEAPEEELQMKVQRKPIVPVLQKMGAEGGVVSQTIEQQINSAKGSGNPLAPKLQTQMGQAMGADFSGVKIHTDSQADQLNQSVQAKAFTTGKDVFFRKGAYQPGSKGGQELIAHELTHVVQQSGNTIRRDTDSPQQKTAGVGGTVDSIDQDLGLLYAEAEAAQGELYKKTIDVANQTNGKASLPPTLKGKERATEKTKSDYGGDASRLVDIARGSIIYDSYFNLLQGLEACQSSLTVVREKNRFATPTPAGYRDILLNVQLSNGHIAELQLHLAQILDVKSGIGHKLYEEMRTIQSKAEEAKRALTSEEQAKVDKLIAESKVHYDAAFAESQSAS